jgi:hypothetical protein
MAAGWAADAVTVAEDVAAGTPFVVGLKQTAVIKMVLKLSTSSSLCACLLAAVVALRLVAGMHALLTAGALLDPTAARCSATHSPILINLYMHAGAVRLGQQPRQVSGEVFCACCGTWLQQPAHHTAHGHRLCASRVWATPVGNEHLELCVREQALR